MTGERRGPLQAELYVRSLAPRGATDELDDVLETLDRLSDRGTLTDYDVHVCGQQIPAMPADAGTDFGRFLLNRVAVFSAWADRNDHSLGSLYERRTVESAITGRERDVVRLPVMALAEYEGADLRYIAPCIVDGEAVTVSDRLDALRTGGQTETTVLPEARTDPPTEQPRLVQ